MTSMQETRVKISDSKQQDAPTNCHSHPSTPKQTTHMLPPFPPHAKPIPPPKYGTTNNSSPEIPMPTNGRRKLVRYTTKGGKGGGERRASEMTSRPVA